MGNGGYSQFIPCCFCCCSVLRKRSPSLALVWAPFHRPQFFTNCSNIDPFPQDVALQEETASVWVPSKVTSHARSMFQPRFSKGSQPSLGIQLLQCGAPSMGCRWISAPPWISVDCRGKSCLTMVFTVGYGGDLSSGAYSTSCPSFTTDLDALHSSSCHIVSLISFLTAINSGQKHFLLHKLVITEVLLPSLMGSALASSRFVLELTGSGSPEYGRSFWKF